VGYHCFLQLCNLMTPSLTPNFTGNHVNNVNLIPQRTKHIVLTACIGQYLWVRLLYAATEVCCVQTILLIAVFYHQSWPVLSVLLTLRANSLVGSPGGGGGGEENGLHMHGAVQHRHGKNEVAPAALSMGWWGAGGKTKGRTCMVPSSIATAEKVRLPAALSIMGGGGVERKGRTCRVPSSIATAEKLRLPAALITAPLACSFHAQAPPRLQTMLQVPVAATLVMSSQERSWLPLSSSTACPSSTVMFAAGCRRRTRCFWGEPAGPRLRDQRTVSFTPTKPSPSLKHLSWP